MFILISLLAFAPLAPAQTEDPPGSCELAFLGDPLPLILTHVGPLIITPKRIFWNQRLVGNASTVERRLLLALTRQPNQTVTIPQLITSARTGCAEGSFGQTEDPRNYVNQMIFKIRRRFRAVDAEFDRLRAVRGLGYAWVTAEDPDGANALNVGSPPPRMPTFQRRDAVALWNDQVVDLSASQVRVVVALTRAWPGGLDLIELSAALTAKPGAAPLTDGHVRNVVSNIRKAFRAVDPDFDRLKLGAAKGTYRW